MSCWICACLAISKNKDVSVLVNYTNKCFKQILLRLILFSSTGAGFTLRKDDPAALKATIIEIQTKASSVDLTKFVDQSRVKFMLDVLLAIRNNNMRKIPNFNPDHLEHLKKLTRNYIRGKNTYKINRISVTLWNVLERNSKTPGCRIGKYKLALASHHSCHITKNQTCLLKQTHTTAQVKMQTSWNLYYVTQYLSLFICFLLFLNWRRGCFHIQIYLRLF